RVGALVEVEPAGAEAHPVVLDAEPEPWRDAPVVGELRSGPQDVPGDGGRHPADARRGGGRRGLGEGGVAGELRAQVERLRPGHEGPAAAAVVAPGFLVNRGGVPAAL